MDEVLQSLFSSLKKWITENGGYVNENLGIKFVNQENRTIYAKNKITKNEMFFKIPKNCIINKEKFNVIPSSHDLPLDLTEDIARILIVIYCKFINTNTFYKPYIDLLPSSFNYHPFYKFDKCNIETYSSISEKIVDRFNINFELYKKTKEDTIKINQKYNLINENVLNENFDWGYLIIRTRQWGNGLCPFADLLQHSNSSSSILVQNKDTYESLMITSNDIEEGSIVYDSYGTYDDVTLFVNYGFLNKENPFFNIELETRKNTILPIDIIKDALLTKFLSLNNKFSIGESGIFNGLLELCRIASIDSNDIKLIDFTKEDYYKNIISLDNEARTISNLANIFELKLKETSKTLSFCNDILNNYNEETIEWKIAYLNIGYNKVLKNSVNILISNWNNKIYHPLM